MRRSRKVFTSLQMCAFWKLPFCSVKKGKPVRTIADEIFEDTQISPHIVLETENIETVLALSAQGMGITFYPRMFMSTRQNLNAYKDSLMGQAGLNLFSLNYSRAHGTLAIGYHKGHYMSRATHEFIRIALEHIPSAAGLPSNSDAI